LGERTILEVSFEKERVLKIEEDMKEGFESKLKEAFSAESTLEAEPPLVLEAKLSKPVENPRPSIKARSSRVNLRAIDTSSFHNLVNEPLKSPGLRRRESIRANKSVSKKKSQGVTGPSQERYTFLHNLDYQCQQLQQFRLSIDLLHHHEKTQEAVQADLDLLKILSEVLCGEIVIIRDNVALSRQMNIHGLKKAFSFQDIIKLNQKHIKRKLELNEIEKDRFEK